MIRVGDIDHTLSDSSYTVYDNLCKTEHRTFSGLYFQKFQIFFFADFPDRLFQSMNPRLVSIIRNLYLYTDSDMLCTFCCQCICHSRNTVHTNLL